VPKQCPEVPESVLYPAEAWPNKDQYMNKYRQLAARFIENFRKFETQNTDYLKAAGPKIPTH
jgi:phosphoenolpyruvate carboxykinase (ATP)